jgi:membrane protein implicated in regulation of membrane protease activity/DNA-binding ferritin-like protein (Dps family)
MSEALELNKVVLDCERYWRATGVPGRRIADMKLELSQHLAEATSNGRQVESVIGGDLAEFAETWAAEYRASAPTSAWEDVRSGRAALRQSVRREFIGYGLSVVVVVAGVAIAASGGDRVENETWRWLWTGLAIVMGIGEIFTAGFFLLPFAIGAAAAAILAWLGVAILAQWLVFFGVSLFAFMYLRRFITRQDEMDQPAVGANRWINARGIVLEPIDPLASVGMVRILGEEWRATSDGPIPAGAQVVVTEVRGARLVVSPVE